MNILDVTFGQAKLPGHMDTYDAIAVNDSFEEIGFYQHHGVSSWYWNHVAGMVIRNPDGSWYRPYNGC